MKPSHVRRRAFLAACTSAVGPLGGCISDTDRGTATRKTKRSPTRPPTDGTPTTEPASLPDVTTEDGQFVVDGEQFFPHGFNYIRLRDGGGHDTFNPDRYDGRRAGEMLRHLLSRGFTLLRVFIDHNPETGVIPEKGSTSFAADYVDNVVDFLLRARELGIRVMVTVNWLPARAQYTELTDSASKPANVTGVNNSFMFSGRIRAHAKYVADLTAAIQDRDPAALSAVFAMSIRNEAKLHGLEEPFTLDEGEVTPANGKTYDVSSESELQALCDDSFVHYVDEHVKAIREVDPDVKVSMGVSSWPAMHVDGPFDFQIPKDLPRWKTYIPARLLALTESEISFIDAHAYPIHGEASEYFDDWEMDELQCELVDQNVPVLLGEFGAHHDQYASIGEAAGRMGAWWSTFAQKGIGGFAYWTYQPNGQERLIMATEGDGQIFDELTRAETPQPLRSNC